MFVCVGITQDRIDECRGAKETVMLADVQAQVQNGADLNAQYDNGATLVRQGASADKDILWHVIVLTLRGHSQS